MTAPIDIPCPENRTEADLRHAKLRPLVVTTALLLSLNLRPAITSVAAALPALPRAFGADFSPGSPWLLALGSAPVLAFGLSAPLGPWLARRWGLGPALTTAMLALAAALALRVANPTLLLPGTVMAGSAIMVASVLIPQLVKETGGATWLAGLTTMGFGGGAALGAAFFPPTVMWAGVPGALAGWALPALVAGALAWATLRPGPRNVTDGTPQRLGVPSAAMRGPGQAAREAPSSALLPGREAPSSALLPGREAPPSAVLFRPLHRSRTALAITAYLGVQALLYFAVTSWLPTFLADRGASGAEASGLLAWYSVAGLPASLIVPMLVARAGWARILGPGLGVVTATGLAWVLFGPLDLMPGAIALLGLAQSSTFAFSLALIVLRSRDAAAAGRLSALAQGAGFALAAVGPYAVGWAHSVTGDWTAAFAGMAAGALVLVALGAMAVRGSDVG